MTMNAGQLDSFGLLGKALGILDDTGNPNAQWFEDPVGSASNTRGLRDILGNDSQRDALIEFVDEVLGPPERLRQGQVVWVPLFQETNPQVTIYAVLEPTDTTVRLGIGVEHAMTGGAPRVATRIHVPLFQLARGTAPAPGDINGVPGWLLIGREGGRIGLTVDVTLRDDAPAPREPSLGGIAASIGVPTSVDDDLSIRLELRDLQLPGASAPRSFTLDAASLEELGPDVFELIVGIVRAQADAIDATDATLRPFAALAGMLGLRTVTDLPPLPLTELPTRGIAPVVEWLESVLEDEDARDAWLTQLGLLLNATPDPTRDAVTFALGPANLALGLRVDAGTGGQPALTPWVEIALDARTGARIRLLVDLLRADLATGAVTAIPSLRAEAVFGADAGGAALLTGDPRIGSVHVGFALDPSRRPAFLLTLNDVTVTGRHHELLDLSSPSAALDAAGDVVSGALAAALGALGEAGDLAAALLGVSPPTGIAGIDASALLADPLAEIGRYWNALTADADATAEVLGSLQRLISGDAAVPVPGLGTAGSPWRVTLAPSVELAAWREGGDLLVDVRASVRTPVLAEYEAVATLALTLVRATLSPPAATFGVDASATLLLRRRDGARARLPLGPLGLEFDDVGVRASWAPARGLAAEARAGALALTVPGDMGAPVRIDLPLPRIQPDGSLVLDSPDWDDIEAAVAGLLGSIESPALDSLLRLIGWSGSGPRLRLGTLIEGDAAVEVQGWLTALLLDCASVRGALTHVAALLSGFQLTRPLGVGSARRPYRCPVAGEPRAPGLAAWLVPDCAPQSDQVGPAVGTLPLAVPPEPAAVVDALAVAAHTLADVGDLLVGRDSLAQGISLLVERWRGTDGLIGAPASLPTGVNRREFVGFSYDELMALGTVGSLAADVLGTPSAAVVHVGCEASWLADRAAGTAFDLTTDAPGARIPAAGDGTWFVRLPTPQAAALARPDRGAVGEQAARLAQLLADRTASIVLVGYGAAGAAAIRAAGERTPVTDVITVGTPWAGLALGSLATGLSGDALRLLERLRRHDADEWSDALLAYEAAPLQVAQGVVRRASALVASGDTVPSAEAETRRTGLRVHAAFGALDEDTLLTGIGALVADGIAARGETEVEDHSAVTHTELHVGVDLPVLDLDLGGVLVGAGATLELCSLVRAEDVGVNVGTLRGLLLDLHFGVHDGWLVGGPGALQPDIDVRWLSARIMVPFDGRPGETELVLHEARAFSTFRERWVVRPDADGIAATVALPEVRIMVSMVIGRLRAASGELADLLDATGITRAGGLDFDALDRLLFDPAAYVAGVRTSAAGALAAALRALIPGVTGSGTSVGWTVGPATLSFDLATRAFSGTLAAAAEAGLPPLTATVTASPAGISAQAAFGELDADAGGLRLVARAGSASDVAVEWQAPGGAIRRVGLLPVLDTSAIGELVTVAVPAALLQALATAVRARAGATGAAAIDAGLDTIGLLGAAEESGERAVRLPVGLIADPAGWLTHATSEWRTSPATAAVRLLDALAPVLAPGRGGAAGWPLGPGVVVHYAAEGPRLRLAADVALSTTIDGAIVTAALSGGLSIGPGTAPRPVVSAAVAVDGRGLRLDISPDVRLFLDRPAPAVPLQLYPGGPGLGSAISAAAESALPPILNALIDRRTDVAASLVKDVATAVFDLGGALDLLDAQRFTAARLTTFAADPMARLTSRIPQLAATGTAALARALDPAGTVVSVTGPTDGVLTLGFGPSRAVQLVLDGASGTPALELRVSATLPHVGRIALDSLRLSVDGVQLTARIGPANIPMGALTLRPLIVIRAGVASGAFTRLFGIGLAFDEDADTSVEFRWALDATPPNVVVVTRGVSGELLNAAPEAVAARLLGLAASMATTVLIEQLGPALSTRATELLQGVLFVDTAGSTELDPALFDALTAPERLLNRLQRLLWNAATATPPLSLTIEDTVTIALAGDLLGGGRRALGIRLTLAGTGRFAIASGDPTVELEVDAGWINPTVAPGLSVLLLEGTPLPGPDGGFTFEIAPAVRVAGIGLRFSKPSGPLLDLGAFSLDAIAVHAYGEAGEAGVGGGAQLQLEGFAIAPSGAGGDNPVANAIMADASAAGTANRPAFSPAIAVQIHPGQSGPSVSLRAGDPPGPWWLRVQRQLGPLYLEQVGFDAREQDGRIVRISLLFDGRVSLFGLTAAVDQLSITWLGGDVLDVGSWAVDLQGLAISADFSGVSLAGGLLKSTAGGQVSFVGMLIGRFGTYGLSVFGGYTEDRGTPSFFVFGAVNGPIGGPPMFFLTGIGGGLGINRGLRVPEDMARFNEYPFIRALDVSAPPPSDPMTELRRLGDYFPPVRGNFWFAAGISFTCFSLVDGIAVVSVSFGDGLEINLFGLARMALPRPQAALISIELGLLARFSTREGLFSIRAQLTENSWLLYPDVRLTGGFAFVVWWKGLNRGQFVLTLGGYHPSFQREGYPDVPRLGLVWQVTPQIVVKGGSYFALTSEALMAGVEVEVSADFGWAWARIGFGAHGIVYFDPFWFEVEAYARIAAGVKIETFLGTVRFGISLGANIKVWGPEFSGQARLEVGPASFTVGFGSKREIPQRTLDWLEFVTKYLEDAGGRARALSSITGRGTLPAATDGDVAAPSSDGTRERPFEVFAEFEVTITSTIPVQQFALEGTGVSAGVAVTRSDGAPYALGLRPMRASALTSGVTLRLERDEDGTWLPAADRLQRLAANLGAAQPKPEGSAVITDAFPIGAWGPPEPDAPVKPLPKGDVVFAANQIRLVAEAAQMNRGPEMDYYRVEFTRRPLPLQAGGSARGTMLSLAGDIDAAKPAVADTAAALAAARTELFERTAPLVLPDGVLERGSYSNLARAAFAGDRTSPPLFGTLADGLAPLNAEDATAARQDAPAAPVFRGMRPPVVSALLTAGAGVVPRAPDTTVRNRRTARRAAPTLASVQARLAMHLPIRMVITDPPAAAERRTVVPTGTVPRTEAPGTARSYLAGPLGGVRGLESLVGGLRLEQKARTAKAAAPTSMAAGDVIILSLPDAALDVETRNRPALAVAGAARVAMLRGDGSVLRDARVADGVLAVPAGTATIAVQAGSAPQLRDGLAGWHASGRVAGLGASAAIGAGCVLTVDGARTGRPTGWTTAAELVAGAGAVGTHFSDGVRTLVVVLAGAEPERVDALELELAGARRTTRPDGTLRPPTVVLRGSEAALIYAVQPTGAEPVAVRVRSGGDWRIAGVLGGAADVDAVARLMVERGPLAVVQRILAVDAAPCTVTWQQAGAKAAKKAVKKTAKKSRRPVPAGRTPKRGK